MQKKHAWDKLIKLTGNIEEDFNKIVSFLEEQNMTDKLFLLEEPQFFPKYDPTVKKTIYEKNINNFTVHVEIETKLLDGKTFLQDAWVETK